MSDPSKLNTSILVVDDEESLRLTFKMFLEREGYEPVVTASTIEKAIELVEKQSFDLIISDIVMEGASGLDLLRRVRELELECPVVMVTGYPNINTAAEAVRLGAFDYLAKPVKKNDLLRTARMAIEQFSLLKEKGQLEEEKEKYQQYLETIFRSVRDNIITFNHEMIIEKMNNSAEAWAKTVAPGISEGSHVQSFPETLETFKDDVKQVLKTGKEVHEHRIEADLEGVGHSVFRVSSVPLETHAGHSMGVVLVFRDVSHIEALEQRGKRAHFHRLVGSSRAMQTVYTLIENVGQVDTSVLITGESGTGKELVAEALHAESSRSDMPLVKVDCTAIPENLLESELFGHKKGSFTGADRDRKGRILQADGGTLFLDEIGDISSMMQLRLLRFLQERTFYPVGEDKPITVDVRVIAATNADLKKKVSTGEFREDLYYRLRVVDIILPPLRDRDGDLSVLANHFLARFSKRLGKAINGISDQALTLLQNHNWPGNIRELEHVIERASVLCSESTITVSDLPEEIQLGTKYLASTTIPLISVPVGPVIHEAVNGGSDQEAEEDRIVRILKQTGGNKAKAARLLGIDRSTLYRKMHFYKIDQRVE